MKRFKIENHASGLQFEVEREELGEHQPEWGKPERWVREGEENISDAIDTRQVELLPGMPEVVTEEGEIIPEVPPTFTTEYLLPAEFTIVEEDITQEIAEREASAVKAKKDAKRQARMAFAQTFFIELGELNDAKGLELPDFLALLGDPTLLGVKTLLETGATESARDLLLADPNPAYTAQEISKLVSVINDFLEREKSASV